MRRALAFLRGAALALLLAPLAAGASSTQAVDYTDLWWNPAESGWGAGVTLQEDVVFLTLFVYGADGNPAFLVAPDLRVVAGSTPAATYRGTLYRTTGPHFAVPFDASSVAVTAVGTATLAFGSATSATLSYDVDATAVTKSLVRQSWRTGSLADTYRGGIFATGQGCTSGTGEAVIEYSGQLNIATEGERVAMDLVFRPSFAGASRCRLDGLWRQEGRLGSVTGGAITCEFEDGPSPTTGRFELTEIEFSENGFAGTYTEREGASCVRRGRLGGVRAAH